jgi:peptidoglycan/LPS O-acetylase OafA/YrhL
MRGQSVGERLDAHGGVGRGFDLLRICLAGSIIFYHSFEIVGLELSRQYWEIMGQSIVPAFFVLSGFLVTDAASRSRVTDFLVNRACRILPALAVVVAASALVIGPLLTTYDERAYWADPRTVRYFLSVIGISQMQLPGVFAGMPADQTFNVSLWSIGWEMLCYGMVALFLAIRFLKKAKLLLALFVGIMLLRTGLYIEHPHVIHLTHMELGPFVTRGVSFENILPDQSLRPWSPYWLADRVTLHLTSWEFRVVPFFLGGMLCYLWRYELRGSPWLAAGCALALAVVSVSFAGQDYTPVTTVLTAAPIAYLVAYIGTENLPLPRIFRGDYSYGIYLWGFPVAQIIHLFGADGRSPWLNTLLSLPVALMAGCASWHLVELPVLKRRRFMVDRFRRKSEVAAVRRGQGDLA